MSENTWGLILVDAIFLALAGSVTLWFRAWLRSQREDLDRVLGDLADQRQELTRIASRIERLCALQEARLETAGEAPPVAPAARASIPSPERHPIREAAVPTVARRTGTVPEPPSEPEPARAAGEGRYDRAWELLAQGQQPGEVARRLRLGVAEVELMVRMLRYQQRR
ncbi:MAG: hypothetical protein WDA75_01100 [Candidatus Latescibacterota bacterium]|jgi:hypothetical protein